MTNRDTTSATEVDRGQCPHCEGSGLHEADRSPCRGGCNGTGRITERTPSRRPSDAPAQLNLHDFRAAARRWLESEHVRASHRESGVLLDTLTDLLAEHYKDGVAYAQVHLRTDYAPNEWGCEARQRLGIARGVLEEIIEDRFPGDDVYEAGHDALERTAMPSPCSTEQLRSALVEALALWAEDGLSTVRFHEHERLSALASGSAQKRSDGHGA